MRKEVGSVTIRGWSELQPGNSNLRTKIKKVQTSFSDRITKEKRERVREGRKVRKELGRKELFKKKMTGWT